MTDIKQEIMFVAMSTDYLDSKLPKGYYKYALNIRPMSDIDSSEGGIVNIEGNTLITSPLPSGQNKCIGSYNDKVNSTLFYFVYNSLGHHSIFRFYEDTQTITLIYQSELLNFQEDSLITHADLIDSKILSWTDNFNPPRELNIQRADMNGKYQVANIYFSPTVNCLTNLTMTRRSDGFVVSNGFQLGVGFELDAATAARIFYGEVSPSPGNAFNAYFTFSLEGNYVKVISQTTGTWDIAINCTSIPPSTAPNSDLWVVPQNYYTGDYEMYIDALKYPFWTDPEISLHQDSNVSSNYIRGHVFQFQARPIYTDGQKAAWSPISSTALDFYSPGNDLLKTTKNYVLIDYTDNGRLLTEPYRNMVAKVEIGVKDGNTGSLLSVIVLQQYELTGTYKFYNDGQYASVDGADALKPYDNMPLVSAGTTFFKDRRFYMNNIVGYDEVPTDITIKQHYADHSDVFTWTITGKIVIFKAANLANGSGSRFSYSTGTAQSSGDNYWGGDRNGSGNFFPFRMQQYLPMAGFPVYLAGTTYYAISVQTANPITLPSDFGVGVQAYVHEFKIENVPPGGYSLRVASHLCYTPDTNGVMKGLFGDVYDLTNTNLTWQTTSTRVTMMCGKDCINNYNYEEIITLPATTAAGSVFSLQGRGLPFDGYIGIADLTWDSDTDNQGGTAGYLVDDVSGVNSNSNMPGALKIEGQQAVFTTQNNINATISIKSKFTDHNGYFWAFQAYSKVSSTTLSASYAFSGQNGTIVKSVNKSFWVGRIFDSTGSNLVSSTNTSGGIPVATIQNNIAEVVCFSENNVHNLQTTVIGKVVDQNGTTIDGVPVWLVANGRPTKTDSTGEFKIVVYGHADSQFGPGPGLNYVNGLVINYQIDSAITIPAFTGFNPNGLSQTFDINNPFYINPNTGGYLFPLSPYVATLQILSPTGLKRNGIYQFAIGYSDEGNRNSGVYTDERYKVKIADFNEDISLHSSDYPTGTFKYGQAYVSFEINHTPPSWAKSYRMYMLENQAYASVVQIALSGALYITSYDLTQSVTGIPDGVITNYQSSEATYILLDIKTTLYYKNVNPDSHVAYTYSVGDRIRLIKNPDGTYFNTVYDLEVKGQYGYFVAIEARNDLPLIQQGALVEIYTPKAQTSSQIYYEFGPSYDIITVGEELFHSGTQNQTDSQPAIIDITEGDTYFRKRITPTFNTTSQVSSQFSFFIEDFYASDVFDSRSYWKGRPNLRLPDAKRQRLTNNIIFSDRYVPNTYVNGISSIQDANNEDTSKSLGAIQKVDISGNVLVALHEAGVADIYINQTFFYDAQGQQNVISLSDKVIGTINILKGTSGTKNPESVQTYDGRTYFWDTNNSQPAYRSDEGVELIYGGDEANAPSMRSFFASKRGTKTVFGFIDPLNREYGLTFVSLTESITEPKTTIAYNIRKGVWTSFYSFVPEFYGSTYTNLASFLDGQFWLHNSNMARNTFYGVYKNSRLNIVSGQETYRTNKNWKSIAYKSNEVWTIPTVQNDHGQLSEVLDTDFGLIEDVYWSEFLRDKNTPDLVNPVTEGDILASEILNLSLENYSAEKVNLFYIYLEAFISEHGIR